MCGVLGATALVIGTANAQGRPDTRDYTCADARELVRREGAIVLSTGDHTYSRFVDHVGHCFRNEVTQPQFAPTIDQRQCFAGYLCIPRMLPSIR
ncbi:hypothetical protein D1F64_13400 [Breoghania sp. L-A4]|nr:hypothetical protein D1F64_13400 [Breoghania sp. L-A4]